MTFDVEDSAYDMFMGRYSRELAPHLVEYAGVAAGMRVLDVGCGPGALTERLVDVVGRDHVAAVDPSASFVAACVERFPGVDVRCAAAAETPWPDEAFDGVLAQLVVNFLPDPVAGVVEMRRVLRPGGRLTACTWDYGDGMRMLRVFWDAALTLDPLAPDEHAAMPCTTAPELAAVWDEAGLTDVETTALDIESTYSGFEEWWHTLELGVGPAGAHVASLDEPGRAELREELHVRVGAPTEPFTLPARAWAVRGRA